MRSTVLIATVRRDMVEQIRQIRDFLLDMPDYSARLATNAYVSEAQTVTNRRFRRAAVAFASFSSCTNDG